MTQRNSELNLDVEAASPTAGCSLIPNRDFVARSLDLDDRRHQIDAIKATAIVMVMLIHSAGRYLIHDQTMGYGWWIAMFMDVISRPCVPWFVMVTGFLLVCPAKTANIPIFYKRRFSRILPPFLFWTAIYVCYRFGVPGENISWKHCTSLILGGGVYYHLWFLYMLTGLYLVAPFLSRLIETLDRDGLAILLGLWFAGASILPWLEWALNFKSPIPLGLFGSYFGFLVLGVVLRRIGLRIDSSKKFVGLLVAILTLSFFGTAWLSIRDAGRLNENLLTYLAPNIVVISTITFLLLKDQKWHGLGNGSSYRSRFVRFMSRSSLVIYLAHPLILETLGSQIFTKWECVNWFGLVVVTLGTIIGTITLVWGLLRVPLLRAVVGNG